MTAVLLWNVQKIVAIWQKITAMQIFHQTLIVRKKLLVKWSADDIFFRLIWVQVTEGLNHYNYAFLIAFPVSFMFW